MEEKPDRDVPVRKTPTEAEIVAALETVGKHSPADELNCGGCGYNSCREFAAAMIDGKAETSMCLSYLRTISQKTSNALIKYIPASVVIVDNNLQIIECNRHFAKMCGEDALAAYDSCGNLTGADLRSLIEFSDLFESVFAGGSGDLERFNQIYGDRIFNISVFSGRDAERASSRESGGEGARGHPEECDDSAEDCAVSRRTHGGNGNHPPRSRRKLF